MSIPPESGLIHFDSASGALRGQGVQESVKRLGDMQGLFWDEQARLAMAPETEVYRVQFWKPVADGKEGGLFWGTTILQPGRVGDEYFMTHGHFHAVRDRAEYYATLSGQGELVLMEENGNTWSESMSAGTLHYIPGCIAHRVANTGAEPLIFVGCWPSDAGYDYARIRATGFGKRVVARDGVACLA